jgi:hypothetical protein
MLPESQASQSRPRVFDSFDSSAPRCRCWPCWPCWQLQLDGEHQSGRIRKMAQRSGVRPLHWLRYGFAIARNWILLATVPAPAPGLLPYCPVCACHATRYWSPPTKAAHSSSQPRVFPDSCHPDTFSMKINKDPKDARSRYKRDLPRSLFRGGRIGSGRTDRFNFQDGRWAMGAGPAFQASSVQYSKLFAQRIGAASKRDFAGPDPRSLGLRLRLRLQRSPIAFFAEHRYPPLSTCSVF